MYPIYSADRMNLGRQSSYVFPVQPEKSKIEKSILEFDSDRAEINAKHLFIEKGTI